MLRLAALLSCVELCHCSKEKPECVIRYPKLAVDHDGGV